MAVTHRLHGLLPIQMLHTGIQVDVQVLIGVVVVHVQGDLNIHAAQLTQLP